MIMSNRRVQLRSSVFVCVLILTITPGKAQRPAPAPAQSQSILITGGTIHLGNGKTIDNGAVGFRDGRIDYVGFSYGVANAYDTTINSSEKHVYPGFILMNNTLGLAEIDQFPSSRDDRETGSYTPEVRSLVAYNADSRITPTVRSNGVLLAQICPRGGRVTGSSSVVQLDAWDWEDAVVKADEGIHINWPRAFNNKGWWAEPKATEKSEAEKHQDELQELYTFFTQAAAYAGEEFPSKVDVRMESMRGLFDGSQRLYVHANRVREMQEALLFMKHFDISRMTFVGGYDAWRIAEQINDRDVSVISRHVHSLPIREDDPLDLPYRLPTLLHEKDIEFCLDYTSRMERMGSRNLPFVAGTAAAYGLDRELAVQKITLGAAQILGIASDYGSLERNKSATLFISSGDALDMRSNHVEIAFIDGRKIDLSNHQQMLWKRYEKRYGLY
jgi:hypothetical protein